MSGFGGQVSGHDDLPLGQCGRATLFVGLAIDEMTFGIEVIVDVGVTDANFCKQPIRRNLSIARSRRRKLRCEFSTRLLAQRPTSCFSEFPSSVIAAL